MQSRYIGAQIYLEINAELGPWAVFWIALIYVNLTQASSPISN